MFTVTLYRIIRNGFMDFFRNIWLSIATTSIMVLTLFTVSVLIVLNVLGNAAIDAVQEKVDISVYFKSEVSSDQIIALKNKLEQEEDIKSVEFISKEEALRRFKERHKDQPMILQSLQELETNPLEASLIIKATMPTNYPAIVQKLEDSQEKDLFRKITYEDNKLVINRLSYWTSNIRRIILFITAVFALIATLVMFNTIRLNIYSFREEIEIMKLVGASNSFIRGPFIIEGVMYGIAGCIITSLILYPILYFLGPKIQNVFPETEFNLFRYFLANWYYLLLIQAFFGIFLGIVGGFIAIKRYLK